MSDSWKLYRRLLGYIRPYRHVVAISLLAMTVPALLETALPALLKRIKKRGRQFEQKIPRSYLAALDRLYEEWFARYDLSPTLVLETDRLDYVERLFDRLEVVQAIQKHLT